MPDLTHNNFSPRIRWRLFSLHVIGPFLNHCPYYDLVLAEILDWLRYLRNEFVASTFPSTLKPNFLSDVYRYLFSLKITSGSMATSKMTCSVFCFNGLIFPSLFSQHPEQEIHSSHSFWENMVAWGKVMFVWLAVESDVVRKRISINYISGRSSIWQHLCNFQVTLHLYIHAVYAAWIYARLGIPNHYQPGGCFWDDVFRDVENSTQE